MSQSKINQLIYLILAIVGAIGTWYFNLQAGPDFALQLFSTPVSSSLTVDLLVVIVAFYVWMVAEIRKLSMSRWWLIGIIPITFGIALAFSFPLFLLFRERAISREHA